MAETPVAVGDTLTPRDGAFFCSRCEKAAENKRLPPGWKRDGDLVVCGPCWHRRFTLRCVSIPVIGADEALWKEMRAGWKVALRVANKIARELYLMDDWGDGVDVAKLPKFPSSPEREQRLYRAVRDYAPEYTTVSMSALMHWVRASYLRRRFDLWIGKVSLPTYRGVPWMVRKTGWRTDADGRAVTITCLNSRPTLNLSQSADFAGQRALLVHAAKGELLRGDAKLCEQGKRIMFRAAVWVPIKAESGRSGVLDVASTEKSLLTFSIAGRRAMKPLHMGHLRRLVAAHDDWRQGAADDTKHEKRWPSDVRRDMLRAYEHRCGKTNARLATNCQQIAAMIVGFAARRNLAEIALDLRDRGYIGHFPWTKLAASICSAAELHGIGCATVESEV